MHRKSTIILDAFEHRLKALEQTRRKQEVLLREGQIALRDIHEVYAGIFLSAMVSFEGLIEELFIGLLASKIVPVHGKVTARAGIQSSTTAREILLQGRNYFDWLPYERTKQVARAFFTGGRPFTLLTPDDEKHIEKCLLIRHVIAHQSRYAVKRFTNGVLSSLSLTPRDRHPKAFLRSQFSANPPTVRYEQLVAELYKIASTLCL